MSIDQSPAFYGPFWPWFSRHVWECLAVSQVEGLRGHARCSAIVTRREYIRQSAQSLSAFRVNTIQCVAEILPAYLAKLSSSPEQPGLGLPPRQSEVHIFLPILQRIGIGVAASLDAENCISLILLLSFAKIWFYLLMHFCRFPLPSAAESLLLLILQTFVQVSYILHRWRLFAGCLG